MGTPALVVVVVVIYGYTHSFSLHKSKPFSLHGIGVHVPPHFVCVLVLDLEISLGHLIGDEEKPVLDVLAVFPALILPFFASNIVDLLSWYRILLGVKLIKN